MRLFDFAMLYAVIGVACGLAIVHRAAPRDGRAFASAALAVPLWPLWAPVALGARASVAALQDATGTAARIDASLREGLLAVEGSPLESLLSREAVGRILLEVERAAGRAAELDALLARADLDPAAADDRVAALEARGASPRALASARLHQENVRRLLALRERDRRALEELSDLVNALRTQLVLARYAGSSAEGVGGIVSDMWARVEGLGQAIELGDLEPSEAPGGDLARCHELRGPSA